ncbi:MAG: ABC transporter permease [Minwuia sp.]|nr:ABC transporter permease [Minwuia sp.]
MSGHLLLRRLVQAVPTLFGVSVVVFVLVRVVPGNPIAMMLPPGATLEDMERLRQAYGLDGSIVEQYVIWLGQALQGSFGTSISLRQDVLELVLGRLPATLELAVFATAMAIAVGVLAATTGVLFRGRWPETVIDAVNGFTLAVPDFIWALALILVFGVLLPVLPISGRVDPRLGTEFATGFYLTEALVSARFTVVGDLLAHMIMPAIALALPLAAIITRVLKNSLAEAMVQDYVMIARVKGFSRWRIIWVEALRNASIPALTLTGVQFTFLVGGTVLVEKIFSYPGIGNMAIDAVINRDLPLIQGLILSFAVIFIVVNLLVDLSYGWLNPRLRS